MKINSFTPNLIKAKAKQQVKSFTDNPANCRAFSQLPNNIPSYAFMGLPFQTTTKRTVLPEILKKLTGEVYEIKLFDKLDKTKQKTISALLRFTDLVGYKNYKEIMVHDTAGEILATAHFDTAEWKQVNLTENYARLCSLRSYKRDKYSGAGTALIQATVEKSLASEAKGRIFLSAGKSVDLNDPFVFYYNMGFSVKGQIDNPPLLSKYMKELSEKEVEHLTKTLQSKNKNLENMSIDEQIFTLYEAAASYRGRKLDEISLSFYDYMYLHNEKVQNFWLPKINANPIFGENNRLK